MDYSKIPCGCMDPKKSKLDYSLRTVGVLPDSKYNKPVAPIYNFPIKMQGYSSMCMAFAMAKMVKIQHYISTGESIDFSPAWFYWLKTIKTMEGMVPVFDMEILRKYGALPAEYFYAIGTWDEINAAIEKEDLSMFFRVAEKYKSRTTLTLSSEEIPAYLHIWKAGMISIDVYESFYRTGADGIVPEIDGNFKGGHMMELDEIIIKNGVMYYGGDNSYDYQFGQNGRFYIRHDHPAIKRAYGAVDVGPVTNRLEITIGSKVMKTSGGDVDLIEPAQLINGTTMIPLRAVSEALEKHVEWHPLKPANENHIGSKVIIDMPQNLKDLLVI